MIQPAFQVLEPPGWIFGFDPTWKPGDRVTCDGVVYAVRHVYGRLVQLVQLVQLVPERPSEITQTWSDELNGAVEAYEERERQRELLRASGFGWFPDLFDFLKRAETREVHKGSACYTPPRRRRRKRRQ